MSVERSSNDRNLIQPPSAALEARMDADHQQTPQEHVDRAQGAQQDSAVIKSTPQERIAALQKELLILNALHEEDHTDSTIRSAMDEVQNQIAAAQAEL
jgi:phage I-like protein